MKSARAFLAAAVTVLASVAILVTLLAHYASVLTDSSAFTSAAVSVIRTGAVESLIADEVSSRLQGELGGETVAPPLIEQGVREALHNGQVTGEIRVAARALQGQLASGQARTLTLTLPAVGSAMASSLESRSPQLAAAASHLGTVTVVDVRIPSMAAAAIHDLAVVGRDSSLLVAFSAALVALALILSPDRRRTLLGLGLGALASGLLAAAVYLIGRALVVDQFSAPAARTAARATWNIYLGGLERSGLVLAGIGAVTAALAALARHGRGDRRPDLAWDA